ncbi:CARDB domain-containing protein [Halomicroarcula sp. GCM10025709]|uniref:CARDB domain-containing protein n=1 Tax=Haloarcula TaxID=2237 RepID=UPI0024C31723|nr:CARDB domain-containing protein [Halomicroarcula sp. YJ-61-S]
MRTSTVAIVVFVVVLCGTVVASTTVVASDPPLADAGLDQTVPPGTTVHLDANGSRDPDGQITSVRWRIDGPAGSSATPACRTCRQTTFSPTTVGQYNVTLTVTDDDGQSRSDTLEVVVEPAGGPGVSLSGPATATRGRQTTVTADVTAPSGQLDTLAWVVDGTFVRREPVTGSDATVSLTRQFDTIGPARIRAIAYDTAGRRGAATHGLSVTRASGPPTTPSPPTPPTGPTPGPSPSPGPTPSPGPPSSPPSTNGSRPGGTAPSFTVTELTAPARTTTNSSVPVTATVENTGTARGTYPARLLVDGTRTGRTTVALDPAESDMATFRHRFTQPGTYTLTVGARSTVIEVDPAVSGGGRIFVDTIYVPSDIQQGTTATIYGSVVNTDTTPRTLDTPFAIDGRTLDSRSPTVAAGETKYVAFNAEFLDSGRRTVSIGTASTSVVVTPTRGPAAFRVSRLTGPNRTLDIGERAAFTATIRNTGQSHGTYDATLAVDGTPVQNRSVFVSVGGEKRVRFTESFDRSGQYSVSVGDRSRSVDVTDAGRLQVASLDVPNRVDTGERFDVRATIESTYDRGKVQNFKLYVDGRIDGRKQFVTISGGGQTTLVWKNRHLTHRGAFPREFEVRLRDQRRNVTVVPPVSDDTSNAGSACDGGYVWTDMEGNMVGCLDKNSTDIHYSDNGSEVWIDANGEDGLQVSRNGDLVTVMNDTEIKKFGGKIPGETVQEELEESAINIFDSKNSDDDDDESTYNPGPVFKPGDDGDCGPMGCSTNPSGTNQSRTDTYSQYRAPINNLVIDNVPN